MLDAITVDRGLGNALTELSGAKKKNKNMYQINSLPTRKDKIDQPSASEEGIIPKLTSNVLLCGASGSGKSTLLVNLMTRKEFFHGWFHRVIMISPTARTDDIASHLQLDDDDIFDELDEVPAMLSDLMEEQRDEIEEKGADGADQVCLIFDDCISHRNLLKSKEFITCFIASRHYNFTTMICTQSYTKVPRVCRLQAQHLFYFRGGRSELELLAEEYGAPGLSKKQMRALVDFATEGKFSFLHVNRRLGFESRYRKNLDQIIEINNFPEFK